MNRKEFLISLGVVFLAVTGISGILRNFQDLDLNTKRSVKTGFGSGPYGV